MSIQLANNNIKIESDLFSDSNISRMTLSATRNCCDKKYIIDITDLILNTLNPTMCWLTLQLESSSTNSPIISSLTLNNSIIISNASFDLRNLASLSMMTTSVNSWLSSNNESLTFEVINRNGLETDSLFLLRLLGQSENINRARIQFDSEYYEFTSCNTMTSGVSGDGNSLCIDPRYFCQSSECFEDGIYCFTITAEYPTGKKKIQRFGIYIDNNIKCDIVEAIGEGDYTSHAVNESIHSSLNCPNLECIEDDACSVACRLYKSLITRLDKEVKYDYNVITGGCGCNK